MKTVTFETREEWLAARIGKVTGTKVKELVSKRGNGRKVGFYQLIADRLALPDDGQLTAMDRGIANEPKAIEEFVKATGKQLNTDLVLWMREDNDSIAYSPDAFTDDLTEAVECKCLSSARHIEALLTQQCPKDYEEQVLQAFVVNDKLERLYLCFYDDRLLTKQFFYLTIEREQEKVDWYLAYQREVLKEIDKIVSDLMEF